MIIASIQHFMLAENSPGNFQIIMPIPIKRSNIQKLQYFDDIARDFKSDFEIAVNFQFYDPFVIPKVRL